MKYLLFVLPLFAACRPADVVAEVGGRRITISDVELRARERRASAEDALASLIADERLAASAVSRGLDKKPEVQARLRAVERAVLTQSLRDAEAGAPSDKDLRAAYDASTSLETRQLELAHIFFALPSPVTTEGAQRAQSRATAAWARLLDGENFEDVAKATSEDLATRDSGGTLGVVRENRVDSAIFQMALTHKPGEFSRPVQTAFGYHLVKLLSPVTAAKPTFEEARGQLETQLRAEKLKALMTGLERSLPARTFDDARSKLKTPGKEER